jgi:hypothetical protein
MMPMMLYNCEWFCELLFTSGYTNQLPKTPISLQNAQNQGLHPPPLNLDYSHFSPYILLYLLGSYSQNKLVREQKTPKARTISTSSSHHTISYQGGNQ